MTSRSGAGPDEAALAALAHVETVLCDLDGVVWLARDPIPGAVEAIETIRRSGRRVLFVTNNSVATERSVVEALDSIGVPAHADVVTSAMAAAGLVEPGATVLVAGGAGVVEAVERRGAVALANDSARDVREIDVVIVGLHRDFDYERLARATAAIRSGARFIATNDDATYPTPIGVEPGCGALVAAVSTAAGVAPTIAGKPHRPMAELIERMLGPARSRPSKMLVVGDRPSTDGLFAEILRCPFALVRSGVLPPGTDPPGDARVDFDHADLTDLARALDAAPFRADTDG